MPTKTGFSYFGVRRPQHVKLDLTTMVDEGCSQVLHTWSEEDLAYYKECMAEIIGLSKEKGFSVYVNSWGVGRVFGGEAFSELTARNPGSNQVFSTGEVAPAICPNHPAFQEYMEQWIDAVCATDIDVVFWDEPHFFFRKGRTGEWACRCSICQSHFQRDFSVKMPSVPDEQVRLFRQTSLLKLLEGWTARVRAHGKRNNVCLLPDHFDAGLPDWESVAALANLDQLSTDPYWEDHHSLAEVEKLYSTYSRRLVDLCQRKELEPQMWMKLYRIKTGTENFAPRAAEISHAAGISNLMAWSWRASEYMSWLRSDNPQLAHQAMIDSFKSFR